VPKLAALKKILFFHFTLLLMISGFSQKPSIKWEKRMATHLDGEVFYDLKPTGDNGYIAVGTDSASGYDRLKILDKFWGYKAWIVKLDSSGNLQWQTMNRRSGAHHYQSVQQTSDGGYLAAGLATLSTPVYDTSNFYLVKYSSSGNQVWEKLYGGTKLESANSLIKTGSWGYMMAGYTSSNDGDVTGNHSPGLFDVWLVRTDAEGNVLWKKCYGGSGNDIANNVIQTPDKGYLVAGSSTSSNGDLTANNGKKDAWLFKTDSLGNLLWQKNYGGNEDDGFRNCILNNDGTYTLTGYVWSDGVTTNGIKGQSDLWVAKIAEGGTVLWSKGFGSSGRDEGFSIVGTQDNNYVISGYAGANNNDVSSFGGGIDAWLVKISGSGDLLWQQSAGSNHEEIAMALVYHNEGEFTIGGTATVAIQNDEVDAYIARLGNTNKIKGTLYFDKNINGVKDVGENLFDDATVKSVKSSNEYASQPVGGNFAITVDTGTYITSVVLSNPYYTAVPPSTSSSFATYFNTDSVSFAIQPVPGKRDLIIGAVPVTPARPGFNLTYYINYKNTGTDTIANGQVFLRKDTRLTLVSSNPAVTSTNGDTIKWNYSNLKPQDSASITIILKVSQPPATNINDTLLSMATINPVAGDLTPANDTAIIRQRVQGSYDPNDKSENLGGRISSAQVAGGTFINYIIRFQNTGTDTAFNVTVRDTLDQNLQWNSFQMIAASHPYTLQVNNQNRIAWYFNNLLLPDSNRNEQLSHGFIAYRIKPKPAMVEGDMVKNAAFIYFDYNLPIKTNTQVTTVSNSIPDVVTGINSPSIDVSSMILYPNPTGDRIWLKVKDRIAGKGILSLIDVNGRLLLKKQLGIISLSEFTTSIELSRLSPGIYTILLETGEKKYSQKLILR
jgi:uncharacterized repeat protein (TIGR01451 family)